jgi:hypothetical protein
MVNAVKYRIKGLLHQWLGCYMGRSFPHNAERWTCYTCGRVWDRNMNYAKYEDFAWCATPDRDPEVLKKYRKEKA